jgi:hypothetical protein
MEKVNKLLSVRLAIKRALGLFLIFAATAPAWGAIAIDQVKSTDKSSSASSITSSSFSTTAANELLLAFVSTDAKSAGITVTGVTGASLTWALVQRTNVQMGTAEIWRAFAPSTLSSVSVKASLSQSVPASITVVSFTGVDTSGTNGSGAIGATGTGNANPGAPTASLVTTRNGSWVFEVGNDWDKAISRALGPNQTMVHQYLATVGDTYWVQRQNAPTPSSGTTVTINDTAPTTDRYNLSVVEVLPVLSNTTLTVTGTASPTSLVSGATVVLSQSGTTIATTTIGSNGSYTFSNIANGTYTVTPTQSGVNFTPTSQSVTVTGANATVPAFTATAQTWTVLGSITPAMIAAGATVTLSQNGTTISTSAVDSNGNYSFSNVVNGAYAVTPTRSGVIFSPTSQLVTVNNGNATVPAFTATASGIALVQKNVSGNESTITSISANFLSNNTAGNFLIVTGTAARPAGALSISDTLGNTYTPAMGPVTDANQNVTAYIWYVPSCKGGANTVTLTPATAAALEIHISEWTGLATPSPVDQTASATGTGTAVSSGAATTTVTGELIFGYTFLYNTATAGAGFTPLSLVNGDLDEYQVQSTAGSIAATFTQTSGTWFALMATFKPAGSSSGTTYSISGTVSPAAAGYNLALSGTATGNTTTNSSGSYAFNGLQNGTYTVTPAASGYTFAPSSQNVTVNGANVANVNFTAQAATSAALAIDVNVSKDNGSAASSITCPAFSTTSSNELLLALVATDSTSSNMTATGVTGGGLTWSLVRRTNVQGGTSEIWRAYAASTLTNVSVTANLSQSVVGSMTVLSFSGADPAGPVGATGTGSAASGAPTASLITTRNSSWVLGVGNDYANAVARTVPSNQNLIHQDLSPTGDTYWMQRQNAPTPTSGTSVTINDTAPTNDSYNLTIVEVLPASSGSGGGDTVPPTVAVIAPAPNGYAVAMTTLAANASDNVAVAGVQFMIDGINIGNELTSPPYYMTWDSASVSNGTHTLSVRARDTSNLTSTSSITINVDNSGNPAVVGSWSSVVTLPAVAVNLVLLKNNKLLFYQDGATPEVWDYINNTFTNVPVPADLFCSGHASLADGRILVVGGFGGGSAPLGISNAEIFDPATNQWTGVPSMSYDRWYPTATTLSDGRILVTSGAQKQAGDIAGIPEVYDSSTNQWTKLTNANNPFETYPFINQLSDGRVIHVGGTEFPTDTDILDLNTQTWSVVDSRIIDGGSSAMYLPNQTIKAGSATDSLGTGPSSNTTFLLNMTAPSPSWQQIPSMAYVRSFLNLTVLPDGTVLATGGETDKNGGNIANAVYTAELWSPATQTWTTMSAMKTPREYHGTALLLPDGRVVESGMGADFGNVPDQKSAEFYSPPYLFKGTRPTISQPPAAINYNTSFFVGTSDAASIAKVVLIRLGAVTHFFDQNTRYVPLSFTQAANGLTVTAPMDGRLAPPGYYMLFLVNSNGVPAVAPILQVGP